MIRAVIFDVGYTLIDEARQWASWAQELGVSDDTFMSALKSVIAERRHHRDVFATLRPDFDLKSALKQREAGPRVFMEERDLYPDVRAALSMLKSRRLQIGLAGNQPSYAKRALEGLNLPVDWIANSNDLGVEKPAQEFFRCVVAKTGFAPDQIAYVGDRLDNDVLPAQQAGLLGVFLVRGPWGETHALWPEANQANRTTNSLMDLVTL